MKPGKRLFLLVAALGCVLLLNSGVAKASDHNRTVFTIAEPVRVPGVVLPAGTFVIRLADSNSNRNIVQILTSDEEEVITTFIAIPSYRVHASDKAYFSFWEVPKDQPIALRFWFSPGDPYGQEIAYPEEQAYRFARQLHQNVLAVKTSSRTGLKSAPVEIVTPAGATKPLVRQPNSAAPLPPKRSSR